MDTLDQRESCRGLFLHHRGRSGLIQRGFAARAGVSHRSAQDWEAEVNYPNAERLQALIRVLLESCGLTAGREVSEAGELWADPVTATDTSPGSSRRTSLPRWIARGIRGAAGSADRS